MLLLFLTFVLLPLAAVGVVASLGTRLALEMTVEQALQGASTPVSTDAMLEPLNRVMIAYMAFMLLVAAAATLAFRLVSNRIFSSLEDFRSAVEQIAHGDLVTWLPPPGKDEIGWLSLAMGRMAERIGQMMKSVEQSGRLAVVGEMAAHMAHEVRTPLSSIKMNLQLLQRSADAGLIPTDARVSIDTSLSEIARLDSTVNRMLQFGAPERGSRSRCRVHALVTEAADLLRTAFDKKLIDLRLDLTAESDWIWGDGGRLKGVFLNLLVNARDVLPKGGEILVETQLCLGDGGRQMVAVAVSDTGPGVPAPLRDEIFYPFFTTKTYGCGIGLPAALKTLREHGGDLYLSRRRDGGSGACFVALFPLALSQGDPVSVTPIGPSGETPARGWLKVPRDALPWARIV